MLLDVATQVGLDADGVRAAMHDPANHAQLVANWQEADAKGVIGVPTFVIGEEIFWGQDRIDYVLEYLHELRLARL